MSYFPEGSGISRAFSIREGDTDDTFICSENFGLADTNYGGGIKNTARVFFILSRFYKGIYDIDS